MPWITASRARIATKLAIGGVPLRGLLTIRELERSLRFHGALGYREVTGYSPTDHEGEGLHFLVRPGFSDILTLRVGGPPGVDHFGFFMRDASTLDSAIEELEKAGGPFLEKDELAPGVWSAFLADPDGYKIQI